MSDLLFIHGLRVTATCWDPFRSRAEARGWTTEAPPWPYLDGEPRVLRESPPAGLSELGLPELLAHFTARIEALPSPPVLIGHSLGGLLAQLLLDRGLGRAAVALDPGPIRGVRPPVSGLSTHAPVLLRPWRGLDLFSQEVFARDFANGLPSDQVAAAYDAHIVPAPTKPFLQSALGKHAAVSPGPDKRPLLLVAGTADRTVPASTVHQAYKIYQKAGAPVELLEAPGHSHWLIAEPGWETVADGVLDWVERVTA